MAFPGSPYRNISEARVAKDQLSLRLGSGATTYVVLQSQDSNGNPILTVQPSTAGYSWTSGDQYVVIQFAMNGNLNQVDVLGLSQTVYTPEIINIAFEGNTHASGSVPLTSNLGSVLGWQFQLTILGTIAGFGTKVQLWSAGTGTQPAVATFATPSNLVATFDDLFNPLTATM